MRDGNSLFRFIRVVSFFETYWNSSWSTLTFSWASWNHDWSLTVQMSSTFQLMSTSHLLILIHYQLFSLPLRTSIQRYEVCEKLPAIKPSKAPGLDNVSCRIVKEFAQLRIGWTCHRHLKHFSTFWYCSHNLIEFSDTLYQSRKLQPLKDEGDTTAIFQTPYPFKVIEDFVLTWLIEHVKDKILPKQFAWLTGNFHNELSVDMIQTWLSYLDPSGQHLRLLDFSKVLDRIGHNILIEKLLDLGVHTSLIP